MAFQGNLHPGTEGEGVKRLLSSSAIMNQCLGKATNISISQILDPEDEESYHVKKTGVVCTVGPACSDVDKLVQMIDAGMNVGRLNFSHGDHEYHAGLIRNLREAQKKRPNNKVGIMLDTKGPEIRTGKLKDGKAITLVAGQQLKIVTDYSIEGDSTTISCSYPKLTSSVKPHNIILIADGSVSVEVLECHSDYVLTKVRNTATIGERKNMNLPGVKVDLPCIGPKEKKDILEFAIPYGCQFIAASFVQSAQDVQDIRDVLGKQGRDIKIISKIENMEGLLQFDGILEKSDGIMVARGDLGMEIPSEKVFLAQKLMISKCCVVGKPVITATQMMESMTKNPRPTRAEAADVANAVLDGSDCVMLSGETAGGSFPVEAVQVMAKICREAERCIDYKLLYRALCTAIPTPLSIPEAVARAAVETAECVEAALIVVLTETGQTASLIAKYRPRQRILAVCASEMTTRQLCIHRGIITLQVESFQGTDHVIRGAIDSGKDMKIVAVNDRVVCVHGIREDVPGSTNLLKVVTVE